MNNEEKILAMLESMQSEQRKTNDRLDRLEGSVTNLEGEANFIRGSVVRIENEHGKKLDALFEGYQMLDEKVDRIEEHVSSQDEVILKRVFPKAME